MKKHILAVDDETPILEILSEVLGKRGYEMSTSDSPRDVPAILQQKQVDLVLLDIHMPQKNGFAVYKELEGRNIPVLFVTGHPDSFDGESKEVAALWQEQIALGTTDILYKPFSIAGLYEKVEGLIGEPEQADAPEGAEE